MKVTAVSITKMMVIFLINASSFDLKLQMKYDILSSTTNHHHLI